MLSIPPSTPSEGKEIGPLDGHLLPGLQDPLGRNLHVIVFLQSDFDQLL